MQQGRRDSNPRHSVLETDALPTELRPSAVPADCTPVVDGHPVAADYDRHVPLAALFSAITLAFLAIAAWTASAGQWIIAVCAAALALWMGSFAFTAMRKSLR